MKRKSVKIAGIIILIFTLVANLQYALFNYGLKNANLGQQVFAQSSGGEDIAVAPGSSSGGNTSTGGSSNGGYGSTETVGCYQSTTIKCNSSPYIITPGESKICDFSGKYGPPTSCISTDCYNHWQTRKCVERK